LSRNIADFARLTPQAQISGDDVLSGGQNNRYNAIYIDGAVNNDVLDYLQTVLMVVKQELASLDAIEQFQVSVSPFDVKYLDLQEEQLVLLLVLDQIILKDLIFLQRSSISRENSSRIWKYQY
jgi:hypothetical protein